MIDVINLKKSFGDVEVLKGIDITINKGDIVAIIGPSGSGKSTFLRCLNCMEDPTSGQIIFNGVDIADMKVDINIHRRHMGMVFQHFNLFNNKTVIENIMLAPVYTRCQDLKKAKRKKLFGKGGADASLTSLTKEQIKKEEKEKAKKDMQEKLDYVDKLDELDTSSVEPMSHIFGDQNVFREDEVTNGDNSEAMLANAPKAKEGQYQVPKSIG